MRSSACAMCNDSEKSGDMREEKVEIIQCMLSRKPTRFSSSRTVMPAKLAWISLVGQKGRATNLEPRPCLTGNCELDSGFPLFEEKFAKASSIFSAKALMIIDGNRRSVMRKSSGRCACNSGRQRCDRVWGWLIRCNMCSHRLVAFRNDVHLLLESCESCTNASDNFVIR